MKIIKIIKNILLMFLKYWTPVFPLLYINFVGKDVPYKDNFKLFISWFFYTLFINTFLGIILMLKFYI